MKSKIRSYKILHQISLLNKSRKKQDFNACQVELESINNYLDTLSKDYELLTTDMLELLRQGGDSNYTVYDNSKAYLSGLLRRIDRAKSQKRITEKELQKVSDEFNEAVVESNGLELMLNNSFREQEEHVDSVHQNELDEIARIQFINKNWR